MCRDPPASLALQLSNNSLHKGRFACRQLLRKPLRIAPCATSDPAAAFAHYYECLNLQKQTCMRSVVAINKISVAGACKSLSSVPLANCTDLVRVIVEVPGLIFRSRRGKPRGERVKPLRLPLPGWTQVT